MNRGIDLWPKREIRSTDGDRRGDGALAFRPVGRRSAGGRFRVMAVLALIGAAICSALGCSESPPSVSAGDAPISVLVTVAPLADLVRQVAGDKINVVTLIPAGREPETFAPKAAEIRNLTCCRLFFRIGLASEEPLLPKLREICPDLTVVDLREGLPTLADSHAAHEEHEEHDAHEAGEECRCSTDGIDPHLWMSPLLAGKMAETITRNLEKIDPAHADVYRAGREGFAERLAALQGEIHDRLKSLPNRTIYVFHPAYGYYCREFCLEQRAIESGGRAPKPKELAELSRQMKAEKVERIIVQPEFNRSAADALAESLSVQIAVHSPLEEDYFRNLRRLTDLIAGEDRSVPE